MILLLLWKEWRVSPDGCSQELKQSSKQTAETKDEMDRYEVNDDNRDLVEALTRVSAGRDVAHRDEDAEQTLLHAIEELVQFRKKQRQTEQTTSASDTSRLLERWETIEQHQQQLSDILQMNQSYLLELHKRMSSFEQLFFK
jgi:cell wall assembly regulator SMI1